MTDNYNQSLEGEEMVRDIDVLNEEMEAANARFFRRRPAIGAPRNRIESPTAEHRDSNEEAQNHRTHLAGRRDPALRR